MKSSRSPGTQQKDPAADAGAIRGESLQYVLCSVLHEGVSNTGDRRATQFLILPFKFKFKFKVKLRCNLKSKFKFKVKLNGKMGIGRFVWSSSILTRFETNTMKKHF